MICQLKTILGHLFLHILNKKLAVSTLRHLDNISQIKEKGELKFRALVKVNKFLTVLKGSFTVPALFSQPHVKSEAKQSSIQPRDQVWCCITFSRLSFPRALYSNLQK